LEAYWKGLIFCDVRTQFHLRLWQPSLTRSVVPGVNYSGVEPAGGQ